MNATKVIEVKVVLELSLSESLWLLAFLQNPKQILTTNPDDLPIQVELFEALTEALDLPENGL